MTEQWMSIVEYARTYSLSDMTVRRRIKTGRLHAKLIDNKYFIPVHAASPAPHSQSADTMSEVGEPRHCEVERRAPPEVVRKAQSNRLQDYGSKRPVTESGVIKGHPVAQRTIVAAPTNRAYEGHIPAAVEPAGSSAYGPGDAASSIVPPPLTRQLGGQEISLVETKALLAFCEASLRQAADAKRSAMDTFKSKLEALEAHLATRDLEIKTLRQQVEDLQMLVKYLDPKKRSA